MDKKSFILYTNYNKQINKLSNEQCGKLMKAIFAKVCDKEITFELDDMTDMLFSIIADHIDADTQKYEERCRKNAENGRKGGRPRKTEKTDRFFEKPKKADIDIDIDNDIDNDIESDIDIKDTHTLGEESEAISNGQKNAPVCIEKPRSRHGYVLLDDEAYERLEGKYGHLELSRLIDYLDESAASTNNKNGWKNWEVVINRAAKGNWGKSSKADKKTPMAMNYEQKHYSSADLKAMGIEIFGDT